MSQKILEKITPVVREVFENPDMVVTSDLNADNVADWDSVHHISLIVGIEDATGTPGRRHCGRIERATRGSGARE